MAKKPAPILELVPPAARRRQAIVELLEDYLVLARRGEIDSAVLVAEIGDGKIDVAWAQVSTRTHILGCLDIAKQQILDDETG